MQLALAVGALATSVCVATVVATARFRVDPVGSLEARFRLPEAVLAVGGLVLVVVAVWALAPVRPWASMGLSVAAIATLLPLWAAWPWLGADARAAVLAAHPIAIAGIVLLAAGWSSPPDHASILRHAVVLVAAAGALVHVLSYEPFADPGCVRTCERARPVLEGVLSTRSAVAIAAFLAVAASLLGAIAIRSSVGRAPALVRVAAYCSLAWLAAGPAIRWATWGDDATWGFLLLLQPSLVALLAATACVVEARSWRTRAAVGRITAALSATEGWRGGLGGGIVDVHFSVPGSDRWVDAVGQDVDAPPDGPKDVVLRHDGAPVLRLVPERGADAGDVLAALTPASLLALRNAQLSAVALARLADVRASQRRVVAATEAERRRIERDLHDGAQQRLIGVSFQLNIARARVDAATARTLEGVDRDVRRALEQLRELTHGMVPTVLVDEGLEAALEELASASGPTVTLDVLAHGALELEVATAAYAAVASTLALRQATVERARVSLERMEDVLVVRTYIDIATSPAAAAADLAEVADRVGAVGGELRVSAPPGGGISVSAVLPCAS